MSSFNGSKCMRILLAVNSVTKLVSSMTELNTELMTLLKVAIELVSDKFLFFGD